MVKEKIKNKFNEFDIELSEKQLQQFEHYYNLLIEWNNKFNLTAITEIDAVIEKHFIDSILPLKNLKNQKIIDIGAGAGFPSIPLKIMNPDIELVMVDSVNKKITFLQAIIEVLGLKNARAIHSRVEDLGLNPNFREKYDIVVARAVAGLNTLCEYTLPFVRLGGKFVAYKSIEVENELENAKKAIQILGGNLKSVEKFEIGENTRAIVTITKSTKTPPKYPRGKNKPRLEPII